MARALDHLFFCWKRYKDSINMSQDKQEKAWKALCRAFEGVAL